MFCKNTFILILITNVTFLRGASLDDGQNKSVHHYEGVRAVDVEEIIKGSFDATKASCDLDSCRKMRMPQSTMNACIAETVGKINEGADNRIAGLSFLLMAARHKQLTVSEENLHAIERVAQRVSDDAAILLGHCKEYGRLLQNLEDEEKSTRSVGSGSPRSLNSADFMRLASYSESSSAGSDILEQGKEEVFV